MMATKSGTQRGFNLKRTIWRWHFLAGIYVSPVVLIVSITGALYVFRPELEPLLYPDLLSVTPSETVVSLDRQVAAAKEYIGPDWSVMTVDIDRTQPSFPNGVVVQNSEYQVKTIYVDPYTGKALGELENPNFFGVVLDIHATLMGGMIGRFFVELATCWAIFLAVTGVYLWWPRTLARLKGVWWPRFRAQPYVVVRDIHTLTGIWLLPVLILILVSGLIFSLMWGASYHGVAFVTDAYAVRFDPPKSVPIDVSTTASLDSIWMNANGHHELQRTSIHLPQHDQDSFIVETGGNLGASASDVLVLDQYSGDLLLHKRLSELPVMAQITSWAYPFHVGSVLGITTKIIWLIASLVLALMPITGIAMWLIRRRPHTLGFPRTYEAATPKWLVFLMVMFGVVLPAAGVTLAIAAMREWWVSRR